MTDLEEVVISIIVPVYRAEKFIDRCVDSILKQTFREFEVILIDDGSPDKSGEICDLYAKQDNRVRVIHKKNGGLISAWKAGVNIARGQYIGFVDSDDWIEKHMYDSLYSTIEKYAADIVSCGVIREDNKEKIFFHVDKYMVFNTIEIKENIIPNLLTEWSLSDQYYGQSRCNKLLKKELVLKNMQYLDEKVNMGEDMNLILPCTLDAKKIVCIPMNCYHYMYNEDSMVASTSRFIFENNIIVYEKLKVINRMKSADIGNEINLYYNASLIGAVRGLASSSISTNDKYKIIKLYCENNPAHNLLQYKIYKKVIKSFMIIFLIKRKWYRILIFYLMKRQFRNQIKQNIKLK